jgi:very-short-patch-repair endonuclease
VPDNVGPFVESLGGVARREEILSATTPAALRWALDRSKLERLYPNTFVDAACGDEDLVVWHAALAYTNGAAALSHTTALAVWRLPVPPSRVLHVTTGRHHHFRGAVGLVVHRRDRFTCEPPDVLLRAGLPVTRLEQSIVDSWPLLDGDAKRAPAIEAVARRMTTPNRLRDVLENYPRLAGRRHFTRLLDLLAAGCRSHLELWGYRHIFTGPEFASLKWQVAVELGRRTVYLDALHPETGINFELDGAKHHASPRDRERDLRRDAALQALGYVVVRLPHDWMLSDPDGVRQNALAIMAARRR